MARLGIIGILGIVAAILLGAGISELLGPAKAPAPTAQPATPQIAAAPAAVPATPSQAPPSFDIVKVAPDGTAVIAGRAEPGAKVTVLEGDTRLGAVEADRRGEWVLVPKTPLSPGDRQLRLEATGPGGKTLSSEQSVALSIAPAAPGGGEAALAVALPQAPGEPAKLLQRPDGGPAGEGLSLAIVEYDGKGGLTLSGHATPGAALQLYLDNRPLANAQADAKGDWSAAAAHAGAAPRGELRLDELGRDGKVARRVAQPLVQALAATLAPGQSYVVQPGNNLWQIARRSYGSGLRYLVIYSANSGKIRDPDLIFPGQSFRLPKP